MDRIPSFDDDFVVAAVSTLSYLSGRGYTCRAGLFFPAKGLAMKTGLREAFDRPIVRQA